MKINIKNIFSAIAAAAMLTACVGDLNTIPLNPTDVTSETAYGADEAGYIQGLSKLYFQFVSNNTTDLKVEDAGASEFIRGLWSTQEVTSDAAKNAWPDSWVNEMNTNSWRGDVLNAAVYAVYVRSLQGIAYVNEYLRQTADEKLKLRGVSAELAAKIQVYRAEARFIRAFFYWALVDSFGNVPFSTEDSQFGGGYNPPQTDRATIFNYVIGELEYLASESSVMPAAQSNYPRADKGSCLGLLARMYLNAKVYTGTQMFDKAKSTCERIYALGYRLAPTYTELFRGDNGENPDARGEFLFAAAYDSQNAQSYGGSTCLTCGSLNGTDGPTLLTGTKDGWSGNRVPYEYCQKYFDVQNPDYTAGTYDVVDERGKFFWIRGRKQSIEDLKNFTDGWSCYKFSNIPHDKTADEFSAQAASIVFSNVDFPLIRLGEIHLIYAEACMHVGGDASAQMAALAARANVVAPTVIDENFLIAERARELMWEGHRRTDLVRYGKYTSKDFPWPYKGGSVQGNVDLGDHMNIFPIPSTEMASNLDLIQNPGYAGR